MEQLPHIPTCIGVVIDGNRRWAREQNLPPHEGHRQGAETFKEFVRWAHDMGVECVVAYTFSTENWKRSTEEIKHLMNLLRKFLKGNIAESVKEGIRLRIIGQRERFEKDLQELFTEAEEKTKEGTRGTLAFALSYGGRAEILEACARIVQEKKPEEVANMTEEEFGKFLWTADIPDPDLIIRTGGEQRLSNFLPWQSTYSEFFFTPTHWPAFTKEEFLSILDDFSHRERRRGR